MRIWTRKKGEATWPPQPDPLQGLLQLSKTSHGELLVFTGAPQTDLAAIKALAQLAHKVATSPVMIVVTSHPSADWIEGLARVGVELVQYCEEPGDEALSLRTAEPVSELLHRLCPALHTRGREQVTLSVCGRFHDRMVLRPSWIRAWCIRDRSTCPFWRDGKNGSHPYRAP